MARSWFGTWSIRLRSSRQTSSCALPTSIPTLTASRCFVMGTLLLLNSGSGAHSTVRVVMPKRRTAARLLTVSGRTGTRAASSWYIAKLRRAYGPQLILLDLQNETYKALQTDVSSCHRFCLRKIGASLPRR